MSTDLLADENDFNQSRDLLADDDEMDSIHHQLANYGKHPTQYLKDMASNALDITLGAGDSLRNLIGGTIGLPKFNSSELFHNPNSSAYGIGNVLGEVGGFIGGGEVLDAMRAEAEAAPYIGKIAQSLAGKGIPSLSRRAIGAGLYGAIQNPDHREGEAFKLGGESLALDTLFGGAGKIAQGIRNSKAVNRFRGELTPEELKKNLEITRGTNTALGDVLESPELKRLYENDLTDKPSTGVFDQMLKSGKQVRKIGENILQSLGGKGTISQLNSSLKQALKDSYNEASNLSTKNYNKVEDMAEEAGLEVGNNNLSNTASNILERENKSVKLKRALPKSIRKDLQFLSTNPETNKSLKLENIYKGTLGDQAAEFYKSGKKHAYSIYKELKTALEKDIDQSILDKGTPEIKAAHQAAQDFHRTQVIPFKEAEVSKFIRGKKDSDLLLSSFIKKGINDRGSLLNQLMSKLPEDKQKLVPYAYLSQAIKQGKFDPNKFKDLYKNLGESQKEVLLGNNTLKKKLDDYVKLVEMNAEPLSIMANPKTGYRNPIGSSVAKGLGALIGHGTGHGIGALAGYAGGTILPSVFGKETVKRLTSEKVREALVNKMINQKGRPDISLNKYRDLLRGAILPQQ